MTRITINATKIATMPPVKRQNLARCYVQNSQTDHETNSFRNDLNCSCPTPRSLKSFFLVPHERHSNSKNIRSSIIATYFSTRSERILWLRRGSFHLGSRELQYVLPLPFRRSGALEALGFHHGKVRRVNSFPEKKTRRVCVTR